MVNALSVRLFEILVSRLEMLGGPLEFLGGISELLFGLLNLLHADFLQVFHLSHSVVECQ
jgi:hypothetical protein